MLNLLRMNFFRMVHTRSMVIILLAIIAFSAFSSYMALLDLQTETEASPDPDTDEDMGTTFGIMVNTPPLQDQKPAPFLSFYRADISGKILLLFLTIATVLFVNGEEKSGFVKNIAGQTKHRCYLVLAKILTLTAYSFAAFLLYGAGQWLALKVSFGSELVFGFDSLLSSLPCLGLQFLLHMAFISGIAMLTILVRSSTLGISYGILAACGFGAIPAGWIYKLFEADVTPYYLTTQITMLQSDPSAKTMTTALASALLCLVLYNAVSSIWFTKKDIGT